MTSFNDTIKNVMDLTWPMVVVCVLIFSSIRIAYLIKSKDNFILYREIFNLFFMIYILCLFQVVTYQDSNTINNNNLVPFKEILRYDIGTRLFIKNVLGNIVLFIPYGILVCIYTKIKNFYVSFGLITFSSVTIEVTQLLIDRVFDIDDIILNCIGGLIGYFIFIIIDKISHKLPKMFRSNWFLNILSLGFVTILLLYLRSIV